MTDTPTKIVRLNEEQDAFVIEEPFLVVRTPGQDARTVKMDKPVFVVGSSASCDLVIGDEYVSSRHCQFKFKKNGLSLVDLGSTNGTKVGEHLVREIFLTEACTLEIGRTTVELQWQAGRQQVQPLKKDAFCGIVGQTGVMQSLFAKIAQVAPTDHDVLVRGPTGSGKELVARALHDLSPRRSNPYIVINCGAVSPTLIESELFGHEKGAFTGAIGRHGGCFEKAHTGTLFLDEVGELPLELQPKLLRVLENRTLWRVGGSEEIKVDVRVVAATHRNLRDAVHKGEFRQDLFYRLHVIPLAIPSLRERVEDIPLLSLQITQQNGGAKISPGAMNKLCGHDWPGNVRELKNVLLRSLLFCKDATITEDDIDFGEIAGPVHGAKPTLNQLEKESIETALKKTKGNKARAADVLGIARSTLFKKIKDYNLA